MDYPTSLIGVTVVAFTATNLDNLLLLVSWLLLPGKNLRAVAGALALGTALVIAASYLLSWITTELATGLAAYLSYLGVIPLLLGLWKLRSVWQHRNRQAATATVATDNRMLAYTSILLANSGDTVLVSAPLLIDTQLRYHWLLGGIVVGCAALLMLAARWLAAHARKIAGLAQSAELLSALVMIGIGLYILADTANDISG